MKILCPTCGARYSIADERVARGNTIPCRGCGGRIDLASNAVFPESTGRARAGADSRDDGAEQVSEASALFSLAALTDLAQASAAVPEKATEGVAGDDSSLIDLRQLMNSSPARDRKPHSGHPQSRDASTGVMAPLGLVPLGVSPLGTPLPVETTPASRTVISSSPPTGKWVAATLIAVAAAVATTVASLRTGPPAPQAPIPSATVSPAAREHPTAPQSSAGQAPAPPPSLPGSASARTAASSDPAPPATRRPPSGNRTPRRIERRPPSGAKPPTQTAEAARGPCSHCKPTDLMCNMECAAKR